MPGCVSFRPNSAVRPLEGHIIIYSCVTNCYKLYGWSNTNLYFHSFYGSGIWLGTAKLGLTGCNQRVGWGCGSHLELRDLFQASVVVGKIQFLTVVGLRPN